MLMVPGLVIQLVINISSYSLILSNPVALQRFGQASVCGAGVRAVADYANLDHSGWAIWTRVCRYKGY